MFKAFRQQSFPCFAAFFLTVQVLYSSANFAQGFQSVTNLNNLTVSAISGEKPQSKIWTHAGKWWMVMPNSSGTHIWRLDGNSWTSVLDISASTTTYADCKAVGNVTHILLYQGTSSSLVSVEYVPVSESYQLWTTRTSTVPITLDAGVETTDIDIDSYGRLWLASAGTTTVNVRWSDSPYSSWSSPIEIASGINDDDICAVVAFSGKIGVLWSNQNTQRFGFKYHVDGNDPAVWSTDEVPASQSAVNVGLGMADDHLNIKAGSDGTLYAAVKTSYDTPGYPKIALLIRRPAGTWDDLYPVDEAGTRGMLILNESAKKVFIVYSSSEGNNPIVYKSSSTTTISFGARTTLISSSCNDISGTKQNLIDKTVMMASNGTTAYSVMASDYSLVGHWAMEETSGALTLADSSSFGNNAAVTGSLTQITGQRGYAQSFNGSTNYAASPNSSSLNINNAITLAAWIKPGVNTTQDILNKRTNSSTDGYELTLSIYNAVVPQKVFVRFNQKTSGDTYRVNSTTTYPTNGTWLHAAATYDGDTIKLYINGILESSLAAKITIAGNTLPFCIGAQNDGTRKFTGTIDDARVYNVALTQSDIQTLLTTWAPQANAPAAPVLLSPANLATGIAVTPTLTWNSSLNATSYQVQVSTSSDFSATVFNQSGLTATSVSVTPPLLNNTIYFWRVNASNAQGTSGWSSVWSFTTTLPLSVESNGAGYSLDFDGTNDYVDCGNSTPVQITGTAITMEAWIKPTKVATMSILKKTGAIGGGTGYELYCGSAGLLYCRFNGIDASRAISTSAYPTNSTWVHVAATYDGISTKIYVNGVPEGTTAYTSAIVNSTNILEIANDPSTAARFFQGTIDEVRLWNITRSDADIKAYMTKKLAGTETGLVGYWHMDEISGTLVNDETANNIDGTMINMDPATDRIWSSVALGNASANDYSSAGGYTASVNHTDGDIITATTTSGTIAGIQVYRADNNAVRTGSTFPPGYSLDPNRFWGVKAIGTATPTYTIVYNYSGNPSVTNENGIKLLKRAAVSDPVWIDALGVLDTTANTLTITGATGTEYSLAVPLPAPPGTPANLLVTPVSSTTIQLSWTDSSNNETGFEIERSLTGSGGPFALMATTIANVTTFSDSALSFFTEYCYRIRAINSSGASGYSNFACGTTFPLPPIAPANLIASTISSSVIQLNWTDSSNNETGFEVYRSVTGSGGPFTLLATAAANATTYSDTGLTSSSEYCYRVRATNLGGSSGYSDIACETTFPLPPIAPANLLASTISSSVIQLSWTDSSNNETGFEIERSVTGSGGPFTLLASAVANATTYSDTGLTSSSEYCYRIRAINSGGPSGYSNVECGTTSSLPPIAPANLLASTISSSAIQLTWADSSNNETGFEVERSLTGSGGPFTLLATVAANTTTYNDTGLTSSSEYCYSVRAINSGGASGYSNVDCKTLPAADYYMVGHWAMEENSGALTLTDSSLYLNNAAVTGSLTQITGQRAYAQSFNGTTAYVTSPNSSSLNITNNITLAAWIKPGANTTQDILSKRTNAVTDGYELTLSAVTAPVSQKIFVRFNQKTSGDGYRVNSVTTYPTNGTWIHAAATYDGSTIKLYINGVLESSMPAAITIAGNTLPFCIGAQNDGTRKFTGSVDDTRIYNVALTQSEIQTLLSTWAPPIPIPPAPVLLSPADIATGINTSPTLAWNTSPGAASYQVQVSTASDFSAIIFDQSGITATSVSVTPALLNNTVYYWRVNATNITGTSGWSSVWSFTTFSIPAVPVLLSPADLATSISTSPNLAWNSSSGAASYQVQVSTASDFSAIIFDQNGITATSVSVTPALLINNVYYWRVNASNEAGTSLWSSVWSFTTISVPAVPVLLSPADLATGISTSPSLTWNISSGAASYQVQLSTASDFSAIVFDQSGITATSVSVTPALLINTVYYWRVNASNEAGTSLWSSVWSFTIIFVPAVPVLLSPADLATGISTSPSLAWYTSSDALSYQVQVSTASDFSAIIFDQSGIIATSVSITPELVNSTVYYWRVNASNAAGTSLWSSVWSFTTIAAPPVEDNGSGYALDFDGTNDYVDCGNSSSVQITGTAITMEAWVKPMKVGTMSILKKTGIIGGGTGYELYCGSAGFVYCRFNGNDVSRAVSTSAYPSNGTWLHVAATYDGISTKIYINGVLEDTTAYTSAIVNSTNILEIANDPSTAAKFFQGSIDEVRLWNIVRSDSDIKASMTKKLLGTESGLVGYWRMDESSGTALIDQTSNNNDGLMVNMDPPTDHIWSSAALGNASVYDYDAAGGYAAALNHLDGDSIKATTTSGTISGLQVYRADDNAVRTGSTFPSGYTLDVNRFWGVRVIGTVAPTYNLVYNYTGNPSVINETDLKLVKRNAVSDSVWTDASAVLDINANTLTVTGATGTEYALAMGITIPPAAPANLIVTPLSASVLHLSWADSSNNETGFEIERSESGSGGPFILLTTTDANTIAYNDTGLISSTNYCYRVRAINSSGNSEYTNIECGTTPVPTITLTNASLTEFTTEPGIPSAEQSYTVSGINLNTDIEITAPSDFEISLTSGIGFGSTLSLPQTGGVVSATQIFVHYYPAVEGTSGGNITHVSTDAAQIDLPVSGTAVIGALATRVFQEGVNGYSGTSDTHIWQMEPSTSHDDMDYFKWDAESSGGVMYGLLRFDNIFGTNPGQIPPGSVIQSATLTYNVFDTGDFASIYPATVDWDENVTYNTFGGDEGVQPDEYGALVNIASGNQTGVYQVDVKSSLMSWESDTAPNKGWLLYPSGTDGVQVRSSEYSIAAERPKLTIVYLVNPPALPVLISPTDNGTGVSTSPELSVMVSDPKNKNLTVSFYGRPKILSEAPFSIAILPDAQNYTGIANGGLPSMFIDQTQWCVENRNTRNIRYVSMVGDITQQNYLNEWAYADTAMSLLDAVPPGIPYGIALGNHDYANPPTLYGNYFSASRFEGRSYYGGHYDTNNENNYQYFSSGGLDFIIINLSNGESTPNTAVLDWADSLLKAHNTKRAIVVNHSLLNTGNPAGFTGPGQIIYDSLKDNPNLFLMLGGHVPSEGIRSDIYNGNTIYSVLADYQSLTNGGNGYLRILDFDPSINQIHIKTYSPTLDSWMTSSSSQFDIPYTMQTNEFQLIGTNSGVASGTISSRMWPDLSQLTEYEWYVTVSNGENTITGPVWSFTTEAPSVTVNAKALLEGPNAGSGTMTTTLNTNNIIPLNSNDAYSTLEYGYTASIVSSIPNPNIVDWVLVELRSGLPSETKIITRAGFLKNDGAIVDIDGFSPMLISDLSAGNYYIAIHHRNHLSVISSVPIALSSTSPLYDFTTGSGTAYENKLKLINGNWCLYAGDINHDGLIDTQDLTLIYNDNVIGAEGYKSTDLNGDIYTEIEDINIVFFNSVNGVITTKPIILLKDVK